MTRASGFLPCDRHSIAAIVPARQKIGACVKFTASGVLPPREGGASVPLYCRRGLSALAFAAAAFFFSPAHAGGIGPHTAPDDPCPKGVMVNDGSMTAEMFAQYAAVRSMSCGEVEFARPAFFDRRTGEKLTDAEILARIFNGSQPSVIPLPAGVWLLLAGLGALVAVRGRR